MELDDEAVVYPFDLLEEVRVMNDTAGDVPILGLWASGTASALNAGSMAVGADVGAATTYAREPDGITLTLVVEGDRVMNGPLAGHQLEPVVGINDFWFSWAALRPETCICGPTESTAAARPTVPASTGVELEVDFQIDVYPGADVLGGPSVLRSEVLALG